LVYGYVEHPFVNSEGFSFKPQVYHFQ